MINKFVVILGPTATGKTSLAVSLCKKYNGEIISVDSRQAYRGMEIGTGRKVQSAKCEAQNFSIPIHLYDVINPDEQLNAYDYSISAWKKIEEIWSGNKVPFLVGGTGFYLDVILGRRTLAGVGSDPKLRNELENLSKDQLIERLDNLDPQKLETIDTNNKYRLTRAVEIASTPKVIPQGHPLRNSRGGLEERENYLIIGLMAENPYLYKRADERVAWMMEIGLLDEVKRLSEKYGWAAPGLKTLGYREFIPYFEGKALLPEVVQRLKYNTHAYIRRQKTYFKKNTDIKWFDITDSRFDKMVVDAVKSFLS